MSISIELKSEIEEAVKQEAAARGISVKLYIEKLLEQHVSQRHKTSHIGSEEIDQVLDSLAEGLDKGSVLQSDALTRESIYQDHN